MHVTIPKGIVGGFEFTFVQRNLKEWHLRPWTYVCECYRKATQINSTAAIIRNSVLIISHVTFRDCCVHIFSDNLSQNSRMLVTVYHKTRSVSVSLTKNNNKHTKKYNMKWEVAETIMFSKSHFTKKCSNFGLFIFSDIDFYWLNTPGITV